MVDDLARIVFGAVSFFRVGRTFRSAESLAGPEGPRHVAGYV